MRTGLLRAVVALTLAAAATGGAPSHADAAPALGAQEIAGGLTIPWDVAFTPGGNMFVTERAGRVQVYASGEPGAALVRTVNIPAVRAEGEAGLMGIAVDVDFGNNGLVYLCASRTTSQGWRNEVLRYRVDGTGNWVEGTAILSGMLADRIHDGCAVEMDSAGMLWVTMGDANNAALAQDRNSLNGKVLRMHRDGSVPGDNPVINGTRNHVFSMGHRNPQGIAFEPGTGRVFVVEHGPQPTHGDDEINLIRPGGNYGWPCYTGFGRPYQPAVCGHAAAGNYLAPAWSSGAGVTLATSGAAFLSGAQWDDWNGQLFVSMLKESDLRRFAVTCDGAAVHQETLFDRAWGRLRAAVSGPGGHLYVTTSNGTNDRVIRVTGSSPTVHRLAGLNRYATASAISRSQFAAGATDVMVATGTNFPDALAGSAAAGRLGMPVLLTQSNAVPCETRAELDRLNPTRIWVLGGPGAVSDAVMNDMAQYAAPGGTVRLSGQDRYATAAAISARFNPTGGVPAVFVATGQGFADALAGAPAAAMSGAPLLLVRQGDVPQATRDELSRLAPQRIYLLGGPGAVSDAVAAELQAYAPSNPITRLWGNDRYATAAAVSATFWSSGAGSAFVATGRNFPDALAGGAAAGRSRVPLLLVNGGTIPPSTDAEMWRLRPPHVYVLGGEGVVTRQVQNQMDAYTP